jgi:hypothetical protein
MDQAKLARGLILSGIGGMIVCVLWWAIFYSNVAKQLSGRAQLTGDVFQCLFVSTGPCGVVKSLAQWAGYTPYEPMLFWIAGAVCAVGIFIRMSIGGATESANVSSGAATLHPSNLSNQLKRPRSLKDYDEEKWNALIKYDDDVARVADKLRPFGQKWIDEFARSYLVLNDKQYLPTIVKKIIQLEQQERTEGLNAKKLRDFDKIISFMFVTTNGTLAVLKTGSAYLISGVEFRVFSSLEQYRQVSGDISAWREISGPDERISFYRNNNLVIRKILSETSL